MKPLAALLLGLLAFGSAAAAEPAKPTRKPLFIATGDVGGAYFPVGGAVCRILSREVDRNNLHCLVEPTTGSSANLSLLKRGEVDLAVMQARLLGQARKGEGAFTDQAFPNLRAVAALHGEPLLLVVAKSAKITSLAGLKGRKVNLGRPQSFQRMMAETALAAVGLAPADLGAALEIELDQQAVALCDGRLEAAFFTGIHPMATAAQALQECDVEPLDLKAAATEAAKRWPFLAPHVVAADTYPGLDKDVTTLAMKAVLVGTDSLPDEVAGQVAKALCDHFPAFVELYPVLRGAARDGLARDGLTVPLHPGAEKAYREAGVLK